LGHDYGVVFGQKFEISSFGMDFDATRFMPKTFEKML
jgi:hypothetical protein